MQVFRPALLAIFLVAIIAVACGSDDGSSTGVGSESTPTTAPSVVTSPTSTTVLPATSTPSHFDGIETHPLTMLAGNLPVRPDVHATAAPGNEFEFERRIDSFPADGPRPYIEINWNAPIPVATSDQKGLIELLGQIPDTPENRRSLALSDHERWREAVGMETIAFEDGPGAFLERYLQSFEENSTRNPGEGPASFIPGTGQGPFLSGFTDYLSTTNTFDSMGFDGRNVDQTAIAGPLPLSTEIIAGRYSPELTKRFLSECGCPQPDATTEYGGHEYWSWGDGLRGNLRLRLSAPVFDHLGRGGHVLITEDGLYRTLEVELMERLIDTLNGSNPSLADLADHVFIADVMAANGANGILITSADRLTQTEILSDTSGADRNLFDPNGPSYTVSPESNRANALLAPLMLPFDHIATGNGWDGTRQHEVVVLVHGTEAEAVLNAERLADRLVNSNGPDGLPWATKYPKVDISVNGNRLVVVLRDSTRHNYILGNANGQILFAHEPG